MVGTRELSPAPSLYDILTQEALAAGFPISGAVDIDRVDLSKHVQSYDRWLENGHHGAMEYLKRGRDRRANVRLVYPSAQSVFCVALPYPRLPAGATSIQKGPKYARYLQGPDYHAEIASKLESLMASVNARWTVANPDSKPIGYKACVDTSAVLERSWAAACGLGWIGKNTLLIHPQHGSYLFLGEILLDAPVERDPQWLPNYCGSCTRCLDQCPTQAFLAPQTLDSNLCIAYVTLEKRGAIELQAEKKKALKNWVAGCDLCQEVCPFNLKPVKREAPMTHFAHDATRVADWLDLINESESDYRARIKNSALDRVKPAQFRRNVAASLAAAAEELELARAQQLLASAQLRLAQEADPDSKLEWIECVSALEKRIKQC